MMTIKKIIISLIINLFIFISVFSQDVNYARQIIDTLASPYLCGRYYIFQKDRIAAKFISEQLQKNRIGAFDKGNYFQFFKLNANTFPQTPKVKINNKELTAGKDFILAGYSGSAKGIFKVKTLKIKDLQKNENFNNLFIFIPEKLLSDKTLKAKIDSILILNPYSAEGYILEKNDLVFVPSTFRIFYPIIILKKGIFKKIKQIEVDINSILVKNYQTQNIIGKIPGKTDSIILLTAHYDHIGCLGKNAVFTGAHDNASGVAMVLDLARQFTKYRCKPYYTIYVVFFSGEEMGLLGSKYFVENPPFDLSKIKYAINLDLLGSGDEGIMIFNGKENPQLIKKLQKINDKNNLVDTIIIRKNRPNSDHYPLTTKNVKALFILSLGKYKEYHNIYDTRENIPLSNYNNIAKLLFLFLKEDNAK